MTSLKSAEASTPAPIEPTLEVHVRREGKYLSLKAALPLRTDRDLVYAEAKIPAGKHVAFYAVNPRGRVERRETSVLLADSYTHVVFPAGGNAVPLDPDGGTECFLLLAGSAEEAAKDLRTEIEKVLHGKNNLVGATPTLADVVFLPFIAGYKQIGLSMSDYPNVKRWVDKAVERPAWKKVQAETERLLAGR